MAAVLISTGLAVGLDLFHSGSRSLGVKCNIPSQKRTVAKPSSELACRYAQKIREIDCAAINAQIPKEK